LDHLIRALAHKAGYDSCYILENENIPDVPESLKSIVLLIKTYHGEEEADASFAVIHPYYFCAQEAYHAANKLTEELKNQGIEAVQLPNISLKKIAIQLNGFVQRRNSLVYHEQWGSRMHFQAIGIKNRLTCDQSSNRQRSVYENCGSCNLCIEACPTKAINENGVYPKKCLRYYMDNGKGVPAELRRLMGNKLLGCDVCQSVCPHNNRPIAFKPERQYLIEDLLPPDSKVLKELGERIGTNISNKNRICAQTCILAGNSMQDTYLEALEALQKHLSPVVKEQATWAAKEIKDSKER